MKIGYFGDENSHTYAAAEEHFNSSELIGFPSIASAAVAAETGQVAGAVVPIENSIGGTVGDSLDALKKHGVYITEEYYRAVSHSLIAVNGTDKKGIKRIYSHPQAISQCDGYLKANFPNAMIIPVSNTSEALKVIKGTDEAAIARAPLIGQTALETEIEDDRKNTTRFVLLQSAPRFAGSCVSVIFDTRHRSGELLKTLNVLAGYDLNMRKLESRPSRDGVFKYWFYVEFDCKLDKDGLDSVLDELKRNAGFIKFAGMY